MSCPQCPVVQCVRHRGDYVCSSVVFGTMVGMLVFSVMWSELRMPSAFNRLLWSSVYEFQRVECNKQFEFLEFVFDSVYVDLQYYEIAVTFTAVSVCLCCVCTHVVVFGLFVRLSWYPMLMRWLI